MTYTKEQLENFAKNLLTSSDSTTNGVRLQRDAYAAKLANDADKEKKLAAFDQAFVSAIVDGYQKGGDPRILQDQDALQQEAEGKQGMMANIKNAIGNVLGMVSPIASMVWSFVQNLPVIGSPIKSLADKAYNAMTGKTEDQLAEEKQFAGVVEGVRKIQINHGTEIISLTNVGQILGYLKNAENNRLLEEPINPITPQVTAQASEAAPNLPAPEPAGPNGATVPAPPSPAQAQAASTGTSQSQ